MAKRFIDTGLFDDPWFMDLSDEGKILWVYFITKCDHAGIIQINLRLLKLQTGIKDYDKVLKELGNRIVIVKEQLLFIPKFIFFQYPGFPNSKVRTEISAMSILERLGLMKDGKLTLSQELLNSSLTLNQELTNLNKEFINSYGNGNGNGNGYSDGNPEKKDRTLYLEFISLFNQITGKKCKGGDKEERQFNARVSEGYNLEDFKKAIENCKNDSWHIQNPKYLTPEFITRHDKLDRYLNIKATPIVQQSAKRGFVENPNFIDN